MIRKNPNLEADVVEEKNNSDIQYKTAYEFGKKWARIKPQDGINLPYLKPCIFFSFTSQVS